MELFTDAAASLEEQPATYLDAIDHQRRLFSNLKADLLARYLERDRAQASRTARLVSMNGWGSNLELIDASSRSKPVLSTKSIQKLFRGDEAAQRWGGYWLHIGRKGVAINPGRRFLQRFHNEQLHIWDIDHVIITDGTSEASAELERLWTLNREINGMLKDWGLEPHVIHYWLHPEAFDRYGSLLRPIYRQESGSIHRLDLFQDTLSCETVALSEGLELTYAASGHAAKESPLAIRLSSAEDSAAISFFLHTPWNSPWSENYIPLLRGVQAVVAGVGDMTFEEVAKMTPSSASLGYLGVIEIMTRLAIESGEESPKPYILFAEYGMTEGDFRIECLKQLKSDAARKIEERYPSRVSTAPLIIPAEASLSILLQKPLIESAPGLDEPASIGDIFVLRSGGPFSRLIYVPKNAVM